MKKEARKSEEMFFVLVDEVGVEDDGSPKILRSCVLRLSQDDQKSNTTPHSQTPVLVDAIDFVKETWTKGFSLDGTLESDHDDPVNSIGGWIRLSGKPRDTSAMVDYDDNQTLILIGLRFFKCRSLKAKMQLLNPIKAGPDLLASPGKLLVSV
jgi:hypothetical protein